MNWFSRTAPMPCLLRPKAWLRLALPCVLLALLALLLLWHGQGHRFSTLLTSLTQAQNCASLHTSQACNGKDPVEQGCAAPEATTVLAAELMDTNRTAQVRYSTTCHTIWGRIIDSRAGTYTETITLDGTSYHGSPASVHGYYYTPMELLPDGKVVILLVHPARVARDASVRITTSTPLPRSTPPARPKPTPTAPPFHHVSPHQGP